MTGFESKYSRTQPAKKKNKTKKKQLQFIAAAHPDTQLSSTARTRCSASEEQRGHSGRQPQMGDTQIKRKPAQDHRRAHA